MEYKVLDDNGTVLARFDNAAKAMQYYTNNDDLASSIDPQPDAATLEAHGVELKSTAAKKAEQAAQAYEATVNLVAPKTTGLISAAEATEAIRLANEAKYDVGLVRLIEVLINAGGTATAPELNRYQIKKLIDLGYYVAKANGAYTVTVEEQPPLVPTVSKQQKEEENADLFRQIELTKLHKSTGNSSGPKITLPKKI